MDEQKEQSPQPNEIGSGTASAAAGSAANVSASSSTTSEAGIPASIHDWSATIEGRLAALEAKTVAMEQWLAELEKDSTPNAVDGLIRRLDDAGILREEPAKVVAPSPA